MARDEYKYNKIGEYKDLEIEIALYETAHLPKEIEMKDKYLDLAREQKTGEISHEKTWIWQRKRNPIKKTESLLIAQNNAIRTNSIKAKIGNMQKNSKCSPCSGGDETVNHIISKYSKLAQKEYKSRHD